MVKTGIVCGCLPTQAGIEKPAMYHQVIATEILRQTGVVLQVSSTWYTTIAESKFKTISLIEKEKPEIILYHVRPDPYLKLCKLIIRYSDSQRQFHLMLNRNADDSKLLEQRYEPRNSIARKEHSFLKKMLRNFNLLAGLVLRINKKAIRRELNMLNEISAYCRDQSIFLILIGPASRPRSKLENFLLHRLEKILSVKYLTSPDCYVSCFGTHGNAGENLFMDDGVHVSKAGHQRMAQLIFPVMENIIRKHFIDQTREVNHSDASMLFFNE